MMTANTKQSPHTHMHALEVCIYTRNPYNTDNDADGADEVDTMTTSVTLADG